MTNTCPSRQGFRVFSPTRAYVQCQACDATFSDPDNVGSLALHETVRLFTPSTPSVTDDKRTMLAAGWRFVSGLTLEDDQGNTWEARTLPDLAAWAQRAAQSGSVSPDVARAIARLALRYATAR